MIGWLPWLQRKCQLPNLSNISHQAVLVKVLRDLTLRIRLILKMRSLKEPNQVFLDKGIQLEDPNTSPGEMKSEQQATPVVLIKLTMGNSSKKHLWWRTWMGIPLRVFAKFCLFLLHPQIKRENVTQLCFALFKYSENSSFTNGLWVHKTPCIADAIWEQHSCRIWCLCFFERLLDEDTASGDTTTDNLIQKTIRGQTSKCTIHSHLCILDASTPYSDWITEQEAKRNANNAVLPKACPYIYALKDRNRTNIEHMAARYLRSCKWSYRNQFV